MRTTVQRKFKREAMWYQGEAALCHEEALKALGLGDVASAIFWQQEGALQTVAAILNLDALLIVGDMKHVD